MLPASQGRPTIGVLPAYQVYEGTIPHSFLVPLFRGIRSAAQDQNCNVLLACGVVSHPLGPDTVHPAWPVLAPDIADRSSPSGDPRQGTDFVPVGPWNTAGLIVVAPLLSEVRSRYIQELIAAGHPVVFVSAGEVGPTVVTDNEAGIRQALTHLVAHGHQRIAYIAGHEASLEDSEQRLRAYESFIREQALASDPRLIAYGFHNQRSGRWAMERILESGVEFTAVLASNDESAIGALHALRQAGRRVPDDVALIGFDDRLEAAAQLPPLTTVQYPIFEIGYQSVGLLLEYIRGQAQAAWTVRVPTRLIIRQSCGCQPGGVVPPEPSAERLPATSGEWLDRKPRSATRPFTEKTLSEAEMALTRAMTSAVLANARKLSQAEVQALCWRLIEGFIFSLNERDPAPFRSALTELLQSVEAVDDEANAWESAVSVLEAELPSLLNLKRRRSASRRIAALLRQARVAIYESARRRYSRYLVQHIQAADQMGRMTARLHAALDETQILATLEECLPEVGVRSAQVIFFEPEQTDSVAWSVVHSGRSGEVEPRRFRTRAFPPDGLYPAEVSFQLALLPLIVQDEQLGYVAFDVADPPLGTANLNPCADIVWQLAAALRSARLYREAAEGKQLAEKANQLKSRFLSMVSHELRTPLNLIVGLSEMLLREQASPDPSAPPQGQRHDLELIHASTQHLGGLIRDVLDLASSEAGELKLLREPVDLRETLQPVLVTGEQLAREKGLAWQVHLPDPAPWVWGDRTRLRQVVLNLVSNAIKFTEKGKITLEVEWVKEGGRRKKEEEREGSFLLPSSSFLIFRISDTGLGIPLSEQRVIFDEFHQSERTAARGYGGLGLGLAICKRLVELHGGEIGVHSSGEEQAGSTFYFTLPVWDARLAALQETGDTRGALEADDRPQTVLLLTEAAAGGERLREYLTQQGFEVEVRAVDGTDDWLSRLFTSPPGAVVLDLTLASEQGWEVLKALKSHPATQDIPVLFYSLAQERDSGSLLEVDYLTKPLGRTELAQALARHGTLDAGSAPTDQQLLRAILIVDDDPGTLEIHSRIVRSQLPTYRVLEATNGQEALALLRETRVDLVLLDLMMPELDGFGVLQAMRENENTRSTPVIVLTAQVLSEFDMTRLNQGVATVLEKGLFSVEETLAHVEAALARNRKLGSETQRLARKAMAYLHMHYPEPVSRESVARYVGVSEDYLTRCFHQEVGVTPMTYLNRYRINRAKALLEAGRESVEEIAVAVGFSDAHHFRRVFRREVGLSPRAYQRGRAARSG